MAATLVPKAMDKGEFAYATYYMAGSNAQGRRMAFDFVMANWENYFTR